MAKDGEEKGQYDEEYQEDPQAEKINKEIWMENKVKRIGRGICIKYRRLGKSNNGTQSGLIIIWS